MTQKTQFPSTKAVIFLGITLLMYLLILLLFFFHAACLNESQTMSHAATQHPSSNPKSMSDTSFSCNTQAHLSSWEFLKSYHLLLLSSNWLLFIYPLVLILWYSNLREYLAIQQTQLHNKNTQKIPKKEDLLAKYGICTPAIMGTGIIKEATEARVNVQELMKSKKINLSMV